MEILTKWQVSHNFVLNMLSSLLSLAVCSAGESTGPGGGNSWARSCLGNCWYIAQHCTADGQGEGTIGGTTKGNRETFLDLFQLIDQILRFVYHYLVLIILWSILCVYPCHDIQMQSKSCYMEPHGSMSFHVWQKKAGSEKLFLSSISEAKSSPAQQVSSEKELCPVGVHCPAIKNLV